MSGQPLLELAGGGVAISEAGAAARIEVDQQPGAVGLRPGAGQRRGGGPGAARRADPGDQDDRAHPGLADADEERTRRPPGGRRARVG